MRQQYLHANIKIETETTIPNDRSTDVSYREIYMVRFRVNG